LRTYYLSTNLSTLNLLIITSKIRTIAMFVLTDM
jgi:hypothetical protein